MRVCIEKVYLTSMSDQEVSEVWTVTKGFICCWLVTPLFESFSVPFGDFIKRYKELTVNYQQGSQELRLVDESDFPIIRICSNERDRYKEVDNVSLYSMSEWTIYRKERTDCFWNFWTFMKPTSE